MDIVNILKNPNLFNKPLYGVEEIVPQEKKLKDIDLDEFCKAMGWTSINGVLPKRPEKKSKRSRDNNEIDLTDVHKDFTKTDVAKEMRNSILKGIQTKREVKIPSEREAHRQRKVNLI